MTFNWFVVFCYQKPNHQSHFTAEGLLTRSNTQPHASGADVHWLREPDTKMAAVAPPLAMLNHNVSILRPT